MQKSFEQDAYNPRNIHEQCFEVVKNHIQKSLLDERRPELATSVFERYRQEFLRRKGKKDDIESYTVQNLCKRVRSHFTDDLLYMQAENNRRGTIMYDNETSFLAACQQAYDHKLPMEAKVYEIALLLREEILALKPSYLSDLLTIDSILQGDVQPPILVDLFFRVLYTGSDCEEKTTEQKERFIKSSSADAVYACSGGKLLPGKHFALAMGIKSLTGSKSAVTLVNKFGNCASDETIRCLDMELELAADYDEKNAPNEILLDPHLCTGTAWDNFDINIETLSGADTMHHTFGI